MKPTTLRTRREFLGNCGVVTVGAAMPQFLLNTAHSIAADAGGDVRSSAPLPGFKDDRILVVVQLAGGNDGLNTIVPHTDDAYGRLRPRLGVKKAKRLRLDDDLAWNASLKGIKSLYDDGKVAVIEGIGYPNPNRSHFRSMEIWHTAVDSDKFSSTGWIGRYFDNHCSGEAPPTAGVYVGGELPQVFDSRTGRGVAFQTPEGFGWVAGKNGDDSRSFRAMNRQKGGPENASLDFLRKVTDSAVVSTDRVHEVARKSKNIVKYTNHPFSRGMATIARMIAGGLGSRIYYIALGGFDTHANQIGQQERLLKLYADGMAAFQRDLEAMGESRRVVTMTFSEFGRRVGENASNGTDHGTAGPMFVIGDPVNPGLKGSRPSLTDLDKGDLKFTTDFRSVYGTLIGDWFGADPKTVLGREFPRLELIST